ncbi:uncharacterized protein LOC110377533 isoform X3 [Helicoverpa armigera]|uniref:uncharacterized protein LOC110377533 isoform X3 n=1 Tax=Helicoverpa armigera TaxID=29058 RepID=UPI002111A8DA|nr:uncharacterized protein LOC110377533 isoform X2 [Helicoverpa armigera]
MARLSVTLALLFLACACASPARKKLTLMKDTNIGNAFAIGGGASGGIVEGNRVVGARENPTTKPPENNEEVSEVALVNKVNTGASWAMFGSVTASVVRNNTFADRIPFT